MMGSVLQFTAFLCICWLVRGVITYPSQDDDKSLNKKPSNQNIPGDDDFYFEKQKGNDDNVKTGRAIPQSAWSKEEKEQTQTDENKSGFECDYAFSLKNFLSYLLDMVYELKKDIYDIKEMASKAFKNNGKLLNSRDNFEDKDKQNQMEKRNGALKSGDSPKYIMLESINQYLGSNYLTDFYQKNGIEIIDDEADYDALKNFSDESDDSSHKPNKGVDTQDVSKNDMNTYNSECKKMKRKPDVYSAEVKKTITTPASQTKISEKDDKVFDDSKENVKDNNFKEDTTKPSKNEENNSKTSREETENTTSVLPTFKAQKSAKNNNKNYVKNLNEKNEPTKEPLNTTNSLQRKNFDKTKSKKPNQNKIPDNRSKVTSPPPDNRNSGKNSKQKSVSDVNNKYGRLIQSTILSSQNSKDFTGPENKENEPYTSGLFSEKATYRKQQVHFTSAKPENKKQTQNAAKSLKDTDSTNEHTSVFSQPQKLGSEIPNHRMSTNAYALDIQTNDSPNEYEEKRFTVSTTILYSENAPNSKLDRQQTSSIFDNDNTFQSTISESGMNKKNLNKNVSDNFTDKKETNKNEESEVSNANKQGGNNSESQGNSDTEQPKEQHSSNDSKPKKSLKNNKFNYSEGENNNKEDHHLSSMTANDVRLSPDSNSEMQNHDVEGSEKPPEAQENNENLNKIHVISPYLGDEDDRVNFNTSYKMMTMQNFNQNQEGEDVNSRKYDNSNEVNLDNIISVSTNESQISQHTGYVMKEKSQEQYDTFLEYFYKHSNNSLFHSLKNQ